MTESVVETVICEPVPCDPPVVVVTTPELPPERCEVNPCDTDYKFKENCNGTLNVRGGEVQGNDTNCVVIKDTGGCDSFDFSCVKGPVCIDLKEQEGRVGCSEIKLDCDTAIEKIIGSSFADKIAGDCEDNTIRGGKGGDCLTGNGGCDTFQYKSVLESSACKRGWDTIKDFCDDDKIDLSCIDANTKCRGNQDFKWIDDAKFSHKAGQLQFKHGVLSGDTNGDCKADFKIVIPDHHVTYADLVL